MPDIVTTLDPATGRGDWALPSPAFAFVMDANGRPVIGADGYAVPAVRAGAEPGAGLVSGQDIATAVLLSLFTDAAAGPDDVIPDGVDPRGWWADPAIGSKLWLLQRAKRTPQTLQLAVLYAKAALAWLVTDGVAATVEATASWLPGGVLAGEIVITRPSGPNVVVPFAYAWKDL